MATAQVSSVFTARDIMSRTLKNIEGSATRLDKVFGSLRGRIRTAFEFHVVNRGLMLFEQGVRELVGIVPGLIDRGRQWATTVDDISDATGLSAERASELAAVQQRLGGSTDALVRGFAAMSKSVYGNRAAWKEMGIQVVTTNDGGVDAYATFQNLRAAVSATGGSLLSTAAAQKVMGRGGKDMLDLLQLTDKQYRMLADDARRSGQVMSDEAAAAAEALSRAQARFGSTMDGLGTRILNGIGPVLTRFVDGFTTFIQDNMDNIVRFVVGGANTILTVIGELIGMDLGSWSFSQELGRIAGKGKSAGDGIQNVTKAQKQHAAATRDTTSSVRALHEAQRDLQRLQSSNLGFTGDQSNVDQELARQRRLMAIKEAQQRVADARKTLNEIEKGAKAAGVRAGAAYWKGFGRKGGGGGGAGGGIGDIFGDTSEVLAESTRAGKQIAGALKDAIFGEAGLKMEGGVVVSVRQGGLIDKLGQVGTFLGTVAGHLNNLNGLLGGNGPLVLGLLALAKVLPLGGAAGAGGGLLSGLSGALAGALSISVPQLLATAGLAAVPALWTMASGGPYDKTRVAGAPGTNISSDRPAAPWDYAAHADGGAGAAARQRRAQLALLQAGRRTRGAMGSGYSAFGPFYSASNPPASGPGAGFDPGASPGLGFRFEPLLRRYLGESSPTVRTQEDQLGSLASLFGVGQQTADATGTTATQTKPLGDGSLGVVNPNFGGIGTIDKFTAGKVPIDNAAGTYLGIWPTGGKKLPVTGDIGGEPGVVRDQLTVQKSIAKWTQSTSARLGSGGDIVFWLKAINTTIKGRPAGAGTSSLRPPA